MRSVESLQRMLDIGQEAGMEQLLLPKNQAKGDFDTDLHLLVKNLCLEAIECYDAVTQGQPSINVWREAGDVINFASRIAEIVYDKK